MDVPIIGLSGKLDGQGRVHGGSITTCYPSSPRRPIAAAVPHRYNPGPVASAATHAAATSTGPLRGRHLSVPPGQHGPNELIVLYGLARHKMDSWACAWAVGAARGLARPGTVEA